MKIYVCLRQVPDSETRIQIKPDGSGIEESGLKWVMNPYDEYAVEEALKARDQNPGSTVTALSLGPKIRVTDVVRTALAMGADDAVVLDSTDFAVSHPDATHPDATLVARALSKAITTRGDLGLVFTGKLAIDDNSASVPQMLAEFLEVPHVTVVSKITYGAPLVVEREAGGGARETFEITGPCVLAANKGLNSPRYASLPGIMKAKKKIVEYINLGDLVTATGPRLAYKNFAISGDKPAVRMIEGEVDIQARELVRLVVEESKIL